MSEPSRRSLRLVVTGHVDHGKSTLVSKLLSLTGALPQGIDKLKDERAKGITIAASRAFFKTPLRDYLIVDAPGHSRFLTNMVSGASQADAALLALDAFEGVRENSRRHGFLLGFLGIRQAAVLVNKMDLAGWDEAVFVRLSREFGAFLEGIGVPGARFIPVSGLHGDNLARASERMPWHRGPTVLGALDSFAEATLASDRPFRMPVQDVYPGGAVVGSVESGAASAGDEVVFYPSGRAGRIAAIEQFPSVGRARITAGMAAGFRLERGASARRGELVARKSEAPPLVSSRLEARLVWLGREPLSAGRDYALKLGTARATARLEKVVRAIDTSTIAERSGARDVARHEAAECVLVTDRPVAYDPADVDPACGRFVIVDGYEISGGGLILR